MKKTFFGIAVVAIASVGCAPMMPAPIDKIASLPVVKIGSAPPSGAEYVLYIPANSPIPVNLNARGTLLKGDQALIGSTFFTKDLYLYKYWASHDRKSWENSHKLLNVSFNGGMDVSGLNVNIALDTNR